MYFACYTCAEKLRFSSWSCQSVLCVRHLVLEGRDSEVESAESSKHCETTRIFCFNKTDNPRNITLTTQRFYTTSLWPHWHGARIVPQSPEQTSPRNISTRMPKHAYTQSRNSSHAREVIHLATILAQVEPRFLLVAMCSPMCARKNVAGKGQGAGFYATLFGVLCEDGRGTRQARIMPPTSATCPASMRWTRFPSPRRSASQTAPGAELREEILRG